MRKFDNKLEQKIIHSIVEGTKTKDVALARLIGDSINFVALEWENTVEKGWVTRFVVEKEDQPNVDKFERQFYMILALIKYLELEGLIFIQYNRNFYNGHCTFASSGYTYDDVSKVYKKDNEGKIVEIEVFKDWIYTDIVKSIDRYLNCSCYATSSLQNLVERNFQTLDDIRFQKTYKQGKTAVTVAIVIGLVSIIFNIIALLMPTEIDHVQFERMINRESYYKEIIIKDTVRIRKFN